VITGLKNIGEFIEFKLYCKDKVQTVKLDTIHGKMEFGDSKKPGLIGRVEYRRGLYIVSCMEGLDKIAWSRVEKTLNAKIACRYDICVLATLNDKHVLTIKLIDKSNEELDEVNLENIYDFHIGGSEDLLVVSAISHTMEYNSTLLIDPTTVSILDHVTGFGGYILASLENTFVYGFKQGLLTTKVFSIEGEEILETTGIPVLPPFNPFSYPIGEYQLYSTPYIVIMDRNELKVYDPFDYTIKFIGLKPPLTRGVVNVDPDHGDIVVYASFTNKPFIAKFNIDGSIDWISHIIYGFRYALVSSGIVAVCLNNMETRIYRVSEPVLIHEDSFAPAYPIFARGNTIILTDGKLVSSYTLE